MLKKELKSEYVLSLCEDSDNVLQFIADIKWEKGFVCRKCGHTNYCSGKTTASRRCTRCKKDESATAHTIFHNCKFPINKAFYIVYNVCFEKKKISANDLSDELCINPMTCWKFRRKINQCIERQLESGDDNLEVIDVLMHRE